MIETRRKMNAEKRKLVEEINVKVHGNKFFELT
jgi:hypothetical protein